jgi:hypothetical protein
MNSINFSDQAYALSQDVILVPAGSFYCPYWLLNVMLFSCFILGAIIGIGSVYGWKKLYLRIMTKILISI